jgi:hypothetical protein
MSYLYKGFQYDWDYYAVETISNAVSNVRIIKVVYFFIDLQSDLYDNRNFESEEEIKKFIDKKLRLKKLNRILN